MAVTGSREISDAHFVATHLPAPSLERLRIIEVDNLQVTSLFSVSMARSMVQLRALKISNCNNLVQIMSTNEGRGKEIESTGPEASVSWFPHLQELVVTDCEMISSFLFPAFVARGLAQLEELEVSNLPKLKHVFGHHKEEGDQHGRDFYLPRLDKLKLKGLPDLNSLWEGDTSSSSLPSENWDSLFLQCQPMQVLEVSGCSKFSTYFVANMQSQLQVQAAEQPWSSGMKNLQDGQFIMQLYKEEINLIGLSLRDEADIEFIWSGGSQDMCFSSLEWVTVTNCSRLKQVFKTTDAVDDVKVDEHLKSLRFLKIIQCEKLETIFSLPGTLHHLPKLEELHLESNSELSNIFVSGTGDANNQMVEHLRHLRVLKVIQCEKLETIFSLCDSHLPKLKELHLKSNPKLEKIFGDGKEGATNQVPEASTLEALVVSGCPQISSHFLSQLSNQLQAPAKLKIVSLEKIKGVEEVIQLQRKNEDLTFALSWLNLYHLAELKCVWSGPAEKVNFKKLKAIVVKHCDQLERLFTTTIARSMEELRFLTIEQCSKLEQIVVVGDEDGSVVNDTVLFPKLEWLRLKDLPELICFCPSKNYQLKPNFKKHWLKVERCPKSNEVFISAQESTKMEEKAEIQEVSPS